ncbi:hypothetical protein VT930_11780 [Mycobacterium sherrisii]|uniref:hypothetical protein n=1 Tax=Mycobacterium sherrisii TaxID=243061 RepID=UPI002DDD3DF1|nr:hypothetical protein [Mycobacterium sherrisii]MEC4763783.1 hypothetical protein [Mycobacterium sherrisii]
MCSHDLDPENVMRQLVLAAMDNPERLGDLLDGAADCPDCARQALERFAFQFSAWIQDTVDEPEDQDEPLACTCQRPVPAEAMAMRILFGYNAMGESDDGATLREAVVDAARCPACNLAVHVAAARFQTNLLDATHDEWMPDNEIGGLERHYLSMLDAVDTL